MAPKNPHPFEIARRREWVLTRLRGRVQRLVGWFVAGGVLAQLLFVPYWETEISAVPILSYDVHVLPFLLVVVGLATLLLQLLCAHETYHHEVFTSPAEITRIRLSFPFVATTLGLTLAIPAVARPTGYPLLPTPYTAAFTAFSGLSVALVIEYVSKIVWDYTKPAEPSFKRRGVTALVSLISVPLLVFYVLDTGYSSLERLGVTIAGVSTGAVVWLWFTHHYELWKRRETDDRKYDRTDSAIYSLVRDSRVVSVLAGLGFGIGIPVVFGVQRLEYSEIGPDSASVFLVYSEGAIESLIYVTSWVIGVAVLSVLGYLLVRVSTSPSQ